MGGLNSEIEKDTKTVVFESAVFYGGAVRKTAKSRIKNRKFIKI